MNQMEVPDKSFELRKEGYLCSLKQTTVASEPDCAGLYIPISACSHFYPPHMLQARSNNPVLDGCYIQEERVLNLTWAPLTITAELTVVQKWQWTTVEFLVGPNKRNARNRKVTSLISRYNSNRRL
jgi:hypothetical protein